MTAAGSPITIVGAGAIGSIVGVQLAAAGVPVRFIEANRDHVEAIRKGGLRLTGHAELEIHPEVLYPHEVTGPLERVFLAVKARHTLEALAPVAALLAGGGYLLSLQNGLEAARVAEVIGAERTVAASLTFGGYYAAPGEVVYSGPASFRVGELDGRSTHRLEKLASLLSAAHPATTTSNILGFIWSKLALGAFYIGTALVDADVVEILDRPAELEILGALVGEVVEVALAQGVICEVVDGFDAAAFHPGEFDPERARSSWEAQRRYWRRGKASRTGVWRDLAVHRRKTEVDDLLGPVLALARQQRVLVPALEGLVELVRQAEQGKRPLGWRNLSELAAAREPLRGR